MPASSMPHARFQAPPPVVRTGSPARVDEPLPPRSTTQTMLAPSPSLPLAGQALSTPPPQQGLQPLTQPHPDASNPGEGMEGKLMAHMETEVEDIAQRVLAQQVHPWKADLEGQLSRMQETLQHVNQHLEREQRDAQIAAAAAEAEKGQLQAELEVKDQQLEEAAAAAEDLRVQLEGVKEALRKQDEDFMEGKKTLNTHFVRTGQELHDTLQKLREAEEEERKMKEANEVLKEWLDRGAEEIRRASEENDETKRLLKQTADNWEEDHKTLAQRLEKLEDEYKVVAQERGALAVNLTAARARVIEDSKNLYNVVPALKQLVQRCGVVESAIASGNAEPLRHIAELQLAHGEVPPFDSEEIAPAYGSIAARNATTELLDVFQNMHNTVAQMLRAWHEDRESMLSLPQRIQAAQGEARSLKDNNDRLKLKLMELRSDVDKWRQRAAQAEAAQVEDRKGASNAGSTYLPLGSALSGSRISASVPPAPGGSVMPLTRIERQELVQAQTVAATLFREREALQREAENLRRENEDLRNNYNIVHTENKAMRDEVQRLRYQVAQQAAQFDSLNVLPPL